MDASTVSAIFAGVSACAAVGTAAIAGWSLLGARADSRQRTRPLVVASLRRGPSHNHGVIYLVVQNAGRSVARDLTVTFDPALPNYERTADGQPGVVAPFLRRRFGQPIGVVPPGASLGNVYRYVALGSDENVEPVPEQFTLHLSYTDDGGRRYEDTFHLDTAAVYLESRSNPGRNNESELRRTQAIEAVVWELWERP